MKRYILQRSDGKGNIITGYREKVMIDENDNHDDLDCAIEDYLAYYQDIERPEDEPYKYVDVIIGL